MRTDVMVDVVKRLRLPRMCALTPGELSTAGRGDLVQWEMDPESDETMFGRVIGVVRCPVSGDDFLCVACMRLAGWVGEQWVAPKRVIKCVEADSAFAAKAMWLFGDEFLNTPANLARQVFDCVVDSDGRLVPYNPR